MQTSQLRINLPLNDKADLLKVLKKYTSEYVIGHEISKKDISHFHVHFNHKKHIDTIRRKFRKTYPQIKQMGIYLRSTKENDVKSISYVIKDGNYSQEGIPDETMEAAIELVSLFKEEESLKTLRDKILYRLNQQENNKNWLLNTEVMLAILKIFKERNLAYPSQSWIKQCIVSYWMQDPARTLAMNNIEKLYNIQNPFVQPTQLL